MELTIALIILVVGLIIYGFYSRKQIYKEVDRLEAIKMELMHMPVAEEISKVKELNMTGETEELFERWRGQWDDIVTADLPKIDELLFETEEAADKYRFKKAKQSLVHIQESLTDIKGNIQTILDELQNLIGSEQSNRHDSEALEQFYRDVKKKVLAHRYTYGKAEENLDRALSEIKERFSVFEEETENGNYLQARDIVLSIQQDLTTINEYLEEIPKMLTESQTTLPAQLEELAEGYEEMCSQGYVLDHLQVKESLDSVSADLKWIVEQVEDLNIEEAKIRLAEVNQTIDHLYDSLEKEVYAYHEINQGAGNISSLLKQLQDKNKELKEETLFVQQSYQLNEQDLDAYHKTDRELKRLSNLYYSVANKIAEQNLAYTVIQEELNEVSLHLQHVQDQQEAYIEVLQTLRKDELAAKEQIQELRKQLIEAKRLIQKGNLPGVPIEYKERVEEAKRSLQEVMARLQEKPLNIARVNELLELAVETVQLTFTETEDMLQEAFLVERVIQYGNRYRSSYPFVAQSLKEAEESFRKYNYHAALQQAASAIEQVEPGAVERLHSLMTKD
ncbi:septation ring formation regulator EzrA [Priestia abyssalis]|uniref:septation ring formation regulator EzrA n=1 Tax=Priestia abyssalis TaxID=1221450 RepID=UPI0009950DB5|nr:septation ring formation regulator EzrA [Priestia abyssalis]